MQIIELARVTQNVDAFCGASKQYLLVFDKSYFLVDKSRPPRNWLNLLLWPPESLELVFGDVTIFTLESPTPLQKY